MDELEAIRVRVDNVLEEFLRAESARLTEISPRLAPLTDQLRFSVAHGKRLRAAFCYWGWRAAGQPDSDAMIKAAAAMELIHSASVVHDDIIDGSVVRRNSPCAHVALRNAISDAEGREAGGTALAMMLGDLLISLSGLLFSGCGLPGSYLQRARPLWSVLGRELIAGECLEILITGERPDVEEALKVARYKTAKYTVEQPLHIGATLGGAPPELLGTFSEYGIPLGEAFQLRDDVLGVFCDPAETGKSNTDDLRSGRPTALMSITVSDAQGVDKKELERLLSHRDQLDEADLRTIRDIMTRTGARERVESMIAQRADKAIAVIGQARLPDAVGSALTLMVPALISRAN
jgi:geranylgeranyl diphosphate synthase, type I